MLSFSLSALALVFASGAQPAQQPTAQTPTAVYDERADAKADIAAALARAKQENQRVLVQWGANWCSWCRLLHGTLTSNADLKRELLYEYQVVLVDIGKFDKHMELASAYGADLKGENAGVPYLTVLDADGKMLANQETGSFEVEVEGKKGIRGTSRHDPAKLLAFLKLHEAPRLDAPEVFAAGLAQAEKEHKRVFLHLGAPWCGWCKRLEAWMAEPAIAAILEKDFVDVKIDVDRMSNAKEIVARLQVPADTGIPWFAFLDAKGAVLANSMGPKGNVGFPIEPEETAWFVAMLDKARERIGPDDVNALRASLERARAKLAAEKH